VSICGDSVYHYSIEWRIHQKEAAQQPESGKMFVQQICSKLPEYATMQIAAMFCKIVSGVMVLYAIII
jgi:hypothetical protein